MNKQMGVVCIKVEVDVEVHCNKLSMTFLVNIYVSSSSRASVLFTDDKVENKKLVNALEFVFKVTLYVKN